MTIKETLNKANRYSDLIDLLDTIIKSNESSFTLHIPYVDANQKAYWSISSNKVREQAKQLKDLINNGSNGQSENGFTELIAYVRSTTDTYMHNYAVYAMYNLIDDMNASIDIMKVWSILENMLSCWNNNYGFDWEIPIELSKGE